MDSVAFFFNFRFPLRQRRSYSSPISPVVQQHLKQVYLCLCCALLASAAGVYLHILCNLGGFLTFLAGMRYMFRLRATPLQQEQKKVSLLMKTALLQGATIGPLVQWAFQFDPRIVFCAFIGCSLAFGCFSGAAMLVRRRDDLYLAGMLSSGVSILLWSQLASFMFDASVSALLNIKVFALLCYIEFGTEYIIERAHFGDLDYVNHALALFRDFMFVFVRFLEIGSKSAIEKEEKKTKIKKNKKKGEEEGKEEKRELKYPGVFVM